MRYRTSFFLFIILVSSIILSSCTEKKPVIGFMLPHTTIQRYIVEREVFTSKIAELGGEVIFKDAGNDDQKQAKQLDSLLDAGIDLLVLDPVNRFTAAELVRKAHRKGVKVISYDRLISNSEVDAFLSFDPWLVGKQMTEAVTKLKPEGTYIILGGDKSDLNAIGIAESQQKVLEPFIKANKIKVEYNVFIDKWAYEDAYLEVKRYLSLAGKVPDVIIASSDLLARGTIEILKEYKLEGKVLVTGQGGELFACKNIMESNQLMTVYKPVKKLAVLAAELSMKMLKNEDTGDILNTTINNGLADIPTQFLPTIAIDSTNIMSTVVADGMIKKEDLGL